MNEKEERDPALEAFREAVEAMPDDHKTRRATELAKINITLRQKIRRLEAELQKKKDIEMLPATMRDPGGD